MKPSPRILPLAPWAVLAGLLSPSISLAQVQDLGSPFDRSARASKISANGRVVIGHTLFANAFFDLPFQFTDAGGFEILPPLNGIYGGAVDVSNDGTFIAGNIGISRAVRWTDAGAPLDLGSIGPSYTIANAISGDGSTVVGSAGTTSPNYHAFRWTEFGGIVDIHPAFAAAGSSSTAKAVSLDGSVVVGNVMTRLASGAYSTTAFLWTAATGAIDLGAASADDSFAHSLSEDGSVVAGTGRFGTSQLQPYVWTATSGMIPLGEFGTGMAVDVTLSADGSTVLGARSPFGFRWTQTGGLQTFSGTTWFHPTSATRDGEKLAGFLQTGQLSAGAAVWTAATGVTSLPEPAGLGGTAMDLSADGGSVVGELSASSGLRAVRWRIDGTIGDPYCDPAVANSASATGAYLTLSGSNQTADRALELNVTDLPPNSFGFFLAANARGLVAMPGGSQGTLCLGSFIGRFVAPGQIMNSGAQGSFSLTIDPRTLPSPSGPILPSYGETWHFQAWYRDANPTTTSNFSSAASVPVY